MSAVVIHGHPSLLRSLSRPGSQYEDKWLPGRSMRVEAGAHFIFQSPGRSSAILKGLSRPRGELFVARRQVVGGTVATTLSPATVNSCGVLRHWSNALLYVCQDAKRDFSKLFPVPFVCAAHNEKHERKALKCLTRVLLRVPR